LLFLSYAEEDWEVARQVTAMLRELGIDVYNWQGRRGGQFIREIERAISQADGFVALMSPCFLRSQWCRDEWEFAFQREHDLQAGNSDHVFVFVLEVAETPHTEGGFLRGRDWLDITSEASRDDMLAALVNRLIPGRETESVGPADDSGTGSASRGASLFRNRRDELDSVMHGLTNVAGPHFWLIVAPPQLGKTWFLDRLRAEIAAEAESAARWATKLVDLRVQPGALRRDARSLLAQLFEPLIGDERATPLNIAREISRSKRPYLCLLDGAELLAEETVNVLRTDLGAIYGYVQEARNSDVRLAFVVATRSEKGWLGVTPDPRLTVLSLTEFKINVVLKALSDLAIVMNRTFSLPELRLNAERIHNLSEGLPALLVPCLDWIRREEWLEPGQLETEELFAEIAHPYIQGRLLSQDSLNPQAEEDQRPSQSREPEEPLRALEEAFRLLVPYRLFTQSHLRHHVGSDSGFAEALAAMNWSVENMWVAISGSVLLLRPLDEPWQEIYPAIRRLLYRYFYRSAEDRALVHHEARKFVEIWADRQAGKEQVIGLLESLWHEACEVRLTRPAEMEERLSDSAKTLSLALRPSEAYTVTELRAFAADRMRNDGEFQRVLDDNVRLFNRLASIVRRPAEK
jgi:TIR domain